MSEDLRLDVVVEGGVTRVVVVGELDVATASILEGGFESSVLARGTSAVVLDLTGCDFVDSTGARTLVQMGRRVEGEGRTFSVVSPPESGARFTLDLLGVPDSFPVHDSSEMSAADDGTSGPPAR